MSSDIDKMPKMSSYEQFELSTDQMWDAAIKNVEAGKSLVAAVCEAVLSTWPKEPPPNDVYWEHAHAKLAPDVQALNVIRDIIGTRMIGPLKGDPIAQKYGDIGWCDEHPTREEWIAVLNAAKESMR